MDNEKLKILAKSDVENRGIEQSEKDLQRYVEDEFFEGAAALKGELDATKCVKCGNPHNLGIYDAGTDREVERMCLTCFNKYLQKENKIRQDAREFFSTKLKPIFDQFEFNCWNCGQTNCTSNESCIHCGMNFESMSEEE